MTNDDDGDDDDDDAPEDVIEEYDGETNDAGRPHGEGYAWYADGTEYVGGFVDGARSGYGRLWLARDEDEDYDEDDDVPNAFYLGEWKDDRPHGRGIQVSRDKTWLQGNFESGELRGEAYLSTQVSIGDPRYMGEFGDDGAFGGVGTMYNRCGGRLTANWKEGDIAAGLAVWEGDSARRRESTAVVAWTRESFGDAERTGKWTDLVARGAVVVRFVNVDTSYEAGCRHRPEVREFLRALNAVDARPGSSVRAAIEASAVARKAVEFDYEADVATTDLLASLTLARYVESLRVRVSRTAPLEVRATEDMHRHAVVAFYSGTVGEVRGVSASDAERLASDAIMLREEDDEDTQEIVAEYDKDRSSIAYAQSHGVRVIHLDVGADALGANFVRVETKHETNCERMFFENHPIFGDAVFLRTKRCIAKDEELTVAPDYFFGWCLDPLSEAGYYESMRCHPPEVIFERDNDVLELGRVTVKRHGRWRALYLGNVEQGLSYAPTDDAPPSHEVLGFQYIRAMAIATVDRIRAERHATKSTSIVAVGLGTGALPLYLANAPDLNVDVVTVECSQAVIDACAAIHVPMRIIDREGKSSGIPAAKKRRRSRSEPSPIRVHRADALDYFQRCIAKNITDNRVASVDVILLDAYDGDGKIPERVRDDFFIRSVASSLSPVGFCVCNCWDGPIGSEAYHELHMFSNLLDRHFSLIERVSVVGQEYNVILIASRARAPGERLRL